MLSQRHQFKTGRYILISYYEDLHETLMHFLPCKIVPMIDYIYNCVKYIAVGTKGVLY